MKAIGVIPARYGSKRLPGKPLALLNGKPMIQWVYEAASGSKKLSRVIVATDDVRIMRTVWKFGGEAMLTSKKCRSGTDRVAEVTRRMAAEVVVNIQGDEPMMSSATIDQVVRPFNGDRRLLMSTAAVPMKDEEDARSPNVVKVVVDRYGNALYFSRSVIPFYRSAPAQKKYLQHIGIYAYRRDFLLKLTKWKQSPLELAESLEQLRVLERGVRIRVVPVKDRSYGVDTREDLERVSRLIKF